MYMIEPEEVYTREGETVEYFDEFRGEWVTLLSDEAQAFERVQDTITGFGVVRTEIR